MSSPNRQSPAHVARLRQRGVSLVFALLGLTVLSLAAVALVKSVDTGSMVLGNLGFKQDTAAAGDQGVEQAVAWLAGNVTGTVLENNAAAGYVASYIRGLDATGNRDSQASRTVVDWEGNNCTSYSSGTYAACVRPTAGVDVNGNKIKYFVMRLCPTTGAPNSGGNDCASSLGGGSDEPDSDNRGGFDYRKYLRFKPVSGPGGVSAYYRIVVRTTGPRNAVNFTEAIVHF